MSDDKLDDWQVGFDDHATAQRRRMARMTFVEKLDWLESAHELVRQIAGTASGGASVARDLNRTPADE
jgi:hypothetical protein